MFKKIAGPKVAAFTWQYMVRCLHVMSIVAPHVCLHLATTITCGLFHMHMCMHVKPCIDKM